VVKNIMQPTFENILCPSKTVLTDVEPAKNEIENQTKITGHTEQYDHKTHVQYRRTFSNYPWGTLSMQKSWFYTSLPNVLQKVLDRISETISDVEIFFITRHLQEKSIQNLFFGKLPVIQIHKHNGGLENDNGYIHSFHLLFCDCDK